MDKYIRITQIKSSIGILKKHKSTLMGLGIYRIGQTVIRKNTPSLQGMLKTISYMLIVEGK